MSSSSHLLQSLLPVVNITTTTQQSVNIDVAHLRQLEARLLYEEHLLYSLLNSSHVIPRLSTPNNLTSSILTSVASLLPFGTFFNDLTTLFGTPLPLYTFLAVLLTCFLSCSCCIYCYCCSSICQSLIGCCKCVIKVPKSKCRNCKKRPT